MALVALALLVGAAVFRGAMARKSL